MSPKEKKVYYETKLRNLQRIYQRINQQPGKTEDTLIVSNEINHLQQLLDQEV